MTVHVFEGFFTYLLYLFFILQESRETCSRCGRAIMEATLKALGQVYHPNCFVCSMCPQSLEGAEFFVTEDNKPMCKDDFARYVKSVVKKTYGGISGSDRANSSSL